MSNSFRCIHVWVIWLPKLFNESVPSPLRHFVVNQLNEDPIWEPWGQKASDHDIFVLPLLNGLTFHVHGVGCVLWNRTCGCSIKVAPAVHSQHGLLETRGEGGPVRGIFCEMWDSVGEYKERHSECDCDNLQQ